MEDWREKVRNKTLRLSVESSDFGVDGRRTDGKSESDQINRKRVTWADVVRRVKRVES